jgi:hypothetical protein
MRKDDALLGYSYHACNCRDFYCLGAFLGSVSLLTGSFTQEVPRTWLQGTPFSDYTVPAFALGIVIGGGMSLAAGTVFIRRLWAMLIAIGAGIVMMSFEIVEAISLDGKAHQTPTFATMAVLQILFFLLRVTVFVLSTYIWIREHWHSAAHIEPVRPR